MSDCRLNGATIVNGTLLVQRVGNWTFEGLVDTAQVPSGRVTLDLFGDTWSGYVLRAGEFAGRVTVIIVGGAGGLWKNLKGRGYQATTLALPLQEIAQDAGEQLAAAPPTDRLAYWLRLAGTADRCLSQLLEEPGYVWRIQPDGKLWVGRESWPAAPDFEYTVLDDRSAEFRADIASDRALPLPGQTFMDRRVSSVEHKLDGARWRTHVTFEDPAAAELGATEDKERQAIVSIVEDTMRGVDYLARYTGKVIGVKGSDKVDVRVDHPRFPDNGFTCPLRFLPGCEVQLQPGAGVLVGFADGKASAPYCEPFGEGGAVKIVLSAQVIEFKASKIDVGGMATIVSLGGGKTPVALVGDLVPAAPGAVTANPALQAIRGKVLG